MRRWGQIAETKPDNWYLETAQKAYRPDIYTKAANSLIAEGKMKRTISKPCNSNIHKTTTNQSFRWIVFDANKPTAFLAV
jgi:nitrate/nitrite transport system substrate-binding protein